MFRLVGSVGERRATFPLREGRNVVGSAPECDVRLLHPSVSRRHAELIVSGDSLQLTDLRSRNGTFMDGERKNQGQLGAGVMVGFGNVSLIVESVAAADAVAAIELTAAPAAPAEAETVATGDSRPVDRFAAEQLPALLELLRDGAGEARMAAAVGAALFETLPARAIEIVRGEALLFRASKEGMERAAGFALVCARGGAEVRADLLGEGAARLLRPVVESAASLLALAAQRSPGPQPASTKPDSPPPPEPRSVSPAMQRLYSEAARGARGSVSILIHGESGTGKEVLARYIHTASARARKPFVALNCAALPRDLLEAELFGIERGVATGVEARPGKFELAHGGTLFLDEIGDMARDTQARILRVLQESAVFRVGGSVARPADVRIVAATNRDLRRLQAEGEFRSDLYYRIATWVVELPPLRKRRADIGNLAAFFLAREAAAAGVRISGISRAALEALQAYHWPGNVRQLEKEMARAALVLDGGELVDLSCLSAAVREPEPLPPGSGLKAALEDAERRAIMAALEGCGGEVGEAADELGLGRSTLYRRIKELGIAVKS